MDPSTAASTAVTAISVTDLEGTLDLVNSIADAVSSGNYWWAVAAIVFSLVELAKGRIPGTKIKIPAIPKLLGELSGDSVKFITIAGSVAVGAIFVLSGRPVDAALADAMAGWIGALGLHESVDMAQSVLSTLRNKGGKA